MKTKLRALVYSEDITSEVLGYDINELWDISGDTFRLYLTENEKTGKPEFFIGHDIFMVLDGEEYPVFSFKEQIEEYVNENREREWNEDDIKKIRDKLINEIDEAIENLRLRDIPYYSNG